MSDAPTIATRDEAVAFLNARIGQGVKPGLDRIIGLLELIGDPHLTFSTIHVAGTNGKTTVTRLIADILGAHGYRTGTFISPHLHRVEERISIDGEQLTGEAFAGAVADIAWFVEEYERRSGSGVTYFELTAALALSSFAASAIDVAVCYYGGDIHAHQSEAPKCPVMFHWGAEDAAIPLDGVKEVETAHPDIPSYIYEGAGHGFSCSRRGSYHEAAAGEAMERTLSYVAENLS